MNDQYSHTFSRVLREEHDEFLNVAIQKWKFHKNFKRNIITLSLIGIFFLIFAIVFLIFTMTIVEVVVHYDVQCFTQLNCIINIDVPQVMNPPIYVYYEIENFYTPNRRYLYSYDAQQLSGTIKSISQLSNCQNYITNGQMGKKYSLNGKILDPEEAAFPCGDIAATYFNDTFEIYQVPIDEQNIASQNHVQNVFKNPKGYENFAWVDVTNEHFIIWMLTAGIGRFKKIWGRINQQLQPGQYQLNITNNYNVSGFNGRKIFSLSTTSSFGQKNYILVGAYFSGAILCLISISILLIIYFRDKKKKIV